MNRTSAKNRLLNAAADLFYTDGIAGTGIDKITAQAGVAKMSLYNNFASKADLVEAYIDRRCDEWHELLQRRLSQAATPRERVMAVFDSYVDHAELAYARGFRGCGLLNAAAELPLGDPGRASVARQKAEVESLFATYLSEMRPGAEVADVAEHLSFVLEGAMSRAGLEGHDGRLRAARRIASALIDGVER